jgi:hypothetical protein
VCGCSAELAVVSVQRGEVLMRFTSAAQVWAVLEAFGAVRAGGASGCCRDGDFEWGRC